ncbi:MAG: 3-deoxy-manno-octulosonate cytidylyltransferase [Oleiphilaceae bacterium]|nr:3-deoxy-manno-octulosonate cytidylyltransferase [Oleiphilaceae bacterium]
MQPYSVIIPARFASQRLPGKPLIDIAGKPMIRHVYEQVKDLGAQRIIVATDNTDIERACLDFGADVVMTSPDHPSGTDRLEEVVRELDMDDDEIIVNVQGDEPLIPAALIEQVAQNLSAHPEAGIATLCERILDLDTVLNPNAVKVVFDEHGFASYFSRAPIPYARDALSEKPPRLSSTAEYFRHIGMYAYRAGFLKQYVQWVPSMTEKVEKLEQLRALSNGVKIHIELAKQTPPAGVDTQEDLDRVRAHFENR